VSLDAIPHPPRRQAQWPSAKTARTLILNAPKKMVSNDLTGCATRATVWCWY
jgi:hypothetical protein